MNDLMNTETTMTSLEIAELTGKQHDNVLRDIRKMLKELERAALKFEGSYKDASGKENVLFNLPKRECLILVSGYNIKMRAAIIDRWQELESQQKPMSQLEMLAQGFKSMAIVEQRQLALEAKHQEIETVQEDHEKIIEDIKQRQDDMNGDTGYCTALAYCRSKNIPAPLEFAQKLGKTASKICRNRGIRMGKVSDERFRSVNSYPIGVLDECLAEINCRDHQSQFSFDFED